MFLELAFLFSMRGGGGGGVYHVNAGRNVTTDAKPGVHGPPKGSHDAS